MISGEPRLISPSLAENQTQLAKEMGLCEPYPQNTTEWTTVYSTLLAIYNWGTQFNYATFQNQFNVSRPLEVIANQTLLANSSTGAVLRVPLALFSQTPPGKCVAWSQFSADSALSLDQWMRVQCLSVPAAISNIPPGNVFPAGNVSMSGTSVDWAAECKDMGLSPSFALKSNQEVIEYYKLTPESLKKTKRILFTQGGHHSIAAVGPPVCNLLGGKFPTSDNSRVVYSLDMF